MLGIIKNIIEFKLLELKREGIAHTSIFLAKILTFLVYLVLAFLVFISFIIFLSLLIGYYIESYEISFILIFGLISLGTLLLYFFRESLVAKALYRYVHSKLSRLIEPKLKNKKNTL